MPVRCFSAGTVGQAGEDSANVSSTFQPLRGVIFILHAIQSNSSSQGIDKLCGIIDIIFALVSEDTGFVGSAEDGSENNTRALGRGGSEVWRYLARLRARVWRKKGLDPANSLSRDQATMLCHKWSTDRTLITGLSGAAQLATSTGLTPLHTPSAGSMMACSTRRTGVMHPRYPYSTNDSRNCFGRRSGPEHCHLTDQNTIMRSCSKKERSYR